MVPNFVEVPGRQPQFIRECGYPVDMVPVGMTRIGRVLSRTSGVFVVPYNECCGHNLWAPAIEHIRLAGYTGIIRGDKLADALKPPVLSGETHDGIEYLFPVEGWTDVEIGDYLGDSIPQYYRRGIRTSLDCINCTAYLDHNIERLRDLEVTDPRVHAEVTGVLHAVSAEVGRYIESLQSAGGESWVSA